MSIHEQMMLYAERFQKRSEYLEVLVRDQHRETRELLLKLLEILEEIEYNNKREE